MAGNFALDISRWCNGKAKPVITKVIQGIAMETFKRVAYRSPVDTSRFRANWGCQVGSPYTGYDDAARDKSGSATVNKAKTIVMSWNGQGVIYLCNNTKYGRPLEYGYSKIQAPQGMVRVTAAEIMAWAQSASNIKESMCSIRGKTGGN